MKLCLFTVPYLRGYLIAAEFMQNYFKSSLPPFDRAFLHQSQPRAYRSPPCTLTQDQQRHPRKNRDLPKSHSHLLGPLYHSHTHALSLSIILLLFTVGIKFSLYLLNLYY